jgi:general secretion pathway protein D
LIQNQSDHRFWESLADDLEGLLQVDDNTDGMPARFSLNREAGLVTVHARPGVHASVRRYLERLQESVGRQVLIEASVVEVTLSDTYETGIDWQLLANGINGVSAAQVLSGLPAVNSASVSRLGAPAALLSVVQETDYGDVTATLSLLEEFGDVRILSRPRIIALNNQASVLKVVDNRVYFTVNIERRTGDERDEIVTESEIHTVPVGLVMNVTPQIGRGDRVMLNVRPTLSRILGFVDDPNPELALADVRNSVPEIQVRELESMLSVRSGRVAIIGGLMQNASRSRDRGVAGLASLPFVGSLFSQRRREQERSELLIVLRPTVLRSNETPVDVTAYAGMTRDGVSAE